MLKFLPCFPEIVMAHKVASRVEIFDPPALNGFSKAEDGVQIRLLKI
jgi:hypothetical protein